MTPEDFAQAEALFHELAGLDQSARDRILTERDIPPPLRQYVEQLLGHADPTAPPDELGTPVEQALGDFELPADPTQVGAYHIRRRLGEGGMGTVYLAEQTEPIRRHVALKIIKMGMDTRAVIARFEAERQALAMMDHPNVAKVLDAGATETGRPYFVMEYVEGEPITSYCDRHRLTTTERLRLFMDICHAVQHAHQKAIIHRDIKPSNILVTVNDGAPVTKVIDFGVAKAIEHKLTEKTLFTEHGHPIGTPEYMSPEQAEVSKHGVDTRTDIYSLGVVLYELLAGALPFDSEYLRRGALAEIQRIIREEEPPTPSTRLSRLGESDLTAAAMRRSTDRNALGRQLRGDLDWITLRAMDKDRTRRYATPSELADDIKRHLQKEPVQAGPPTAAYRLKKFAHRNLKAVLATMTMALVLIVATAVSLNFAFGQARARKQAVDANSEAQLQAAIANESLIFLANRLLRADPYATPDSEPTVREVLDRAMVDIARDEDGHPVVREIVRMTVGNAYLTLGLLDRAEENTSHAYTALRSLRGDKDRWTRLASTYVAQVLMEQSRYGEAEPILQRAVETAEQLLGEDHFDTMASINDLGEVYLSMGKYRDAERLFKRALGLRERVLGREHANTLVSIVSLASVYEEQGQYDEAETLYSEALEISRRTHGPTHHDTMRILNNLALLFSKQGLHEKAAAELAAVLDVLEEVLGSSHPNTLTTRSNLAVEYALLERYEEALPLFEQVLAERSAVLAPDHADLALAHYNVACMCDKQHDYDRAIALYSHALETLARPDLPHELYTRAAVKLARIHEKLEQFDEAAQVRAQLLTIRRERLGPHDPKTLIAMNNLGEVHRKQHKYDEAEQQFSQAVTGARTALPEGDWHLGRYLRNRGRVLVHLERYAEAEEALLEAYEILRTSLGVEHSRTVKTVRYLATLYENWEQAEPGEELTHKAEEWRMRLEAMESVDSE
jgi:non-specific serine/threonine protein kinase/serine/threonine-protein kinase